jgi:hypothetical protein
MPCGVQRGVSVRRPPADDRFAAQPPSLVAASRGSVYTKPFVLTSLAYLLFFSNVNAYNLLPLYIQALGGREGEIGTIMAMFSVAAILGQATLGGLLDRWPRKPVLLGATGSLAAASATFVGTPPSGGPARFSDSCRRPPGPTSPPAISPSGSRPSARRATGRRPRQVSGPRLWGQVEAGHGAAHHHGGDAQRPSRGRQAPWPKEEPDGA